MEKIKEKIVSSNFTITVTLIKERNTLKVQATCENVLPSDMTYFIDKINDELKSGNILQDLNRKNATYIEEYISLLD